jgi:hypothetical protein
LIGRAPAFFLANVVGDLLDTGRVATAIGLTVVLSILAVLGYLNRDRLLRLFRGES